MWWKALLILISFIAVAVLVIIGFSIGSRSEYRPTRSRRSGEPKSEYDSYQMKVYGDSCERTVAEALGRVCDLYGGYLYNGLCFEDDRGYSSEIDHILITRGGVFVIETKGHKGTIHGDEDEDVWTCIKKDYQDDKTFKNPLRQNQGHINHLKRMFDVTPPKMTSLIIFPYANLSYVYADNVYDLPDAISFIKEKTLAHEYTNEFVKRIAAQIESIKDRYSISKMQHNENIQNYN